MEWYMQYMVARVEKEGEPLTLGKIFQQAMCDKKFDYAKALKEAGFNSDKERIFKRALENRTIVRLPKKNTEKKIIVKGRGLNYPILAQFDGIDTDITLIVENKFGCVWTQQRVDDGIFYDETRTKRQDRQITWYILAYYIKYGVMPRFLLQSFNGKNGALVQLWAERTMFDLDKLVHDINEMVARVEAGDFNKK